MITQLNHIGASIESAAKLTPKANVVLAFSISGQNTPLTIRGRVMSSKVLGEEAAESSPETGAWHNEIQFTDLSSSDLTRIRAWTLQTMPPAPSRV
jgi:hypothetical protein